MSFDERELGELIAESEDLQAEARVQARESLPMLEELAHGRGDVRPGPAERRAFDESRRALLVRLGLAGAGMGTAVASLLARPASADRALDVQMLQTASSLERLAVSTYEAAAGLPFVRTGNKVLATFADTTRRQHDEHRKAFQDQTSKLAGPVQDLPNPRYKAVVDGELPKLRAPLDVVRLASLLENVARDTYLADLAQLADPGTRFLMATVLGVETQHLATLRAVQALLEGGSGALVAIPTDAARLPAAIGSVGFPEAVPTPKMASPAREGATP